MKRTSLKSALLLIVALFATCQVFSQNDKEYKEIVQKLNLEMAKAMLSGDMEKSLSSYADDAISMPSYEPMHIGIKEIRKSSEMMEKSGVKVLAFEPKTMKVILSGNLITEIGTYTMSMSVPGADAQVEDHGKYITIWEKQDDGSLRVKVDTWNSDINPFEKMGGMNGKEKPELKIASPTE